MISAVITAFILIAIININKLFAFKCFGNSIFIKNK